MFRIGQLGDTLASVAAIRAIRDAHPEARLVLVTDRQERLSTVDAWDVLQPTGLVDDVLRFAVPWRLRDLAGARKAIRALAPVRLYYLTPMPRTSWQARRDRFFFATLCGIQDIVGVRSTAAYPVRDVEGRLVRLEPESDRLVAWIGGNTSSGSPASRAHRLTPLPVNRDRAAALLGGWTGSRLIAFGPGSKMQAKLWPLDRFAAVGAALIARYPDVRLLVLGGGPGEERAAADLVRGWGPRAVNLVGLPIWDTAAVLERCSLYVGNDTGTMHLAASVGTPCVAIFSARDNPGRWEPVGPNHVVLRHDLPCAGCLLTECIEKARECLMAISVEEVVQAAARRLQHAGTAA